MKFNELLDKIFPIGISCLCCSKDIFDNAYMICDSCKNQLEFLTGRLCKHCSEPLVSDGDYCIKCKGKPFYSDKIISPFAYSGVVKNFVMGLKYHNQKYYAKALAKFMVDKFIGENITVDLIVAVPLCEKRLKSRGYNQAGLLAENVSDILQVEYNSEILKRVKETPTQTNLSISERAENMRDAFKVVNKKLIKNKVVLLIDDVYTTGATTNECAKILRKAGAKKVYVLTVAHTLRKND